MAAPPFEGAVQETTDWVFWFDVAATLTGADGTVEGVAVTVPVLEPLTLVAVTLKV
jgi:hypothetical protein